MSCLNVLSVLFLSGVIFTILCSCRLGDVVMLVVNVVVRLGLILLCFLCGMGLRPIRRYILIAWLVPIVLWDSVGIRAGWLMERIMVVQ